MLKGIRVSFYGFFFKRDYDFDCFSGVMLTVSSLLRNDVPSTVLSKQSWCLGLLSLRHMKSVLAAQCLPRQTLELGAMTRPCVLVLLAWQLRFVCQRSFTGFQGMAGQPQGPVARTVRRVRERRQVSPRPRPNQRSPEADGYTPAKVITSHVKNSASSAEVLAVMQSEQQNPNMDLIAVAAAWCKLANLQRGINAQPTNYTSLLMLVRLTQSLLEKCEKLGDLEARGVANILWAIAKLQSRAPSQLSILWARLARAVTSAASRMNEQEVANSIWAVATLATLNTDSEALLNGLPALAKRLSVAISKMSSQSVANVIWAMAKLAAATAQTDALLGLPPVLASRLPAVISKMKSQEVANVIWATGQLSVDHSHVAISQDLRKMLPVLVTQAGVVLPLARPQELANSCWGLALSDTHDAAFLQAVAERAASEASGWQPRLAELTLPSVLCSFARLRAVGHNDMLGVAAEKLSALVGKINAWGLCATLWSYQQLDCGDNFLPFRQRLESEVARRQLLNEDVQRSRLGPDVWRMAAGKPKRN